MRKKISTAILFAVLSLCAFCSPHALSAESAESLKNLIYDAKALDKRIPLDIDVVNHQAIVGLSVSRTTPTFEIDSKTAAFSIAKAIMDGDLDITSTLVQFKSAKSSEYNEILIGGGEISAYNAGRKTKEELLKSLELNTMILIDQPHGSDSKTRDRPQSAQFADPSATGAATGNPFSLLPSEADTMGSITSEIPIPAVGSDPNFVRTEDEIKKPKFKPLSPKDKYFSTGRVAFFYPPNWIRRGLSRNDWATPDEEDIAEFACKTRIGQPILSLARFVRISQEDRLSNEAWVGFAFGLEVARPETIKIGYGSTVIAKSILSTGREGLIYFKRVYFKDGFELYALTLKCKVAEAPPLEKDLQRILSTVHSPRTDSGVRKRHDKDFFMLKVKPIEAPKSTPATPVVPAEPEKFKLPPPKDTELRSRPTA